MQTSAEEFAPLAETSWWIDEAIRSEREGIPCPPLQDDLDVDVAIVGGGYTGLWTALALLERNPTLSIAIVEAKICGAGASGKNGGKVHGYWYALGTLVPAVGESAAMEMARAGSRAQDAIRSFAQSQGRDLWWREGGNVHVSTTPGQDARIAAPIEMARRMGVPEMAVALSTSEVQQRCASPVFRAGAYFPEAATIHPGRLVRSLRSAALERGVRIYESSPMVRLDEGPVPTVWTPAGKVTARDVVLATNTALARHPSVAPYASVASSYAVMTEAAPDALGAIGWTGEEGFSDLRMFLHYFRRTPDGRVLMGSGSGPFAARGQPDDPKLRMDAASANRAVAGLRYLLPGLADVPVAKAWGGAIDIASDRFPFFGTVAGKRIHYAWGYSGHGVNATYIGGQCIASLILGLKDVWTASPFCQRPRPRLPPEPMRSMGAAAIRRAILACEAADQEGRPAPALAGLIGSLPRRLGLRIGVR